MGQRQRVRSASQIRRLEHWAGKKPRFALMGEFSAGKSTLLNFLLGKDILPTQVTATELPPVWISHGPEAMYRVDRDGNRHVLKKRGLENISVADTRHIRIFTEAEFLTRCDIVDTPGISDPNMLSDAWLEAVGYVNFAVWCTHATQAWRESERSAWMSLPERIRKHSIMVVTRADKLVNQQDREKVARRMKLECEDLFSEILFMSTLDAIAAKDEGGPDSVAWTTSGAADFHAALAASTKQVKAGREALLYRYVVDTDAARRRIERPVTPDALRPAPVAEDEAEAAALTSPMPRRVANAEGTRSVRSTPRPSPEAVPASDAGAEPEQPAMVRPNRVGKGRRYDLQAVFEGWRKKLSVGGVEIGIGQTIDTINMVLEELMSELSASQQADGNQALHSISDDPAPEPDADGEDDLADPQGKSNWRKLS